MVIINIAGIAAITIGLIWLGWYIVQKVWPAAATSTTGTTVGTIVTKSQEWTAMGALQLIRFMPEVESNAAALSAWEVLYAAVGGTPSSVVSPIVASLITSRASASQDLRKLLGSLAEVTTKSTTAGATEFHFRPHH